MKVTRAFPYGVNRHFWGLLQSYFKFLGQTEYAVFSHMCPSMCPFGFPFKPSRRGSPNLQRDQAESVAVDSARDLSRASQDDHAGAARRRGLVSDRGEGLSVLFVSTTLALESFRSSVQLPNITYPLKTQLFNFLGNMGYMSVKD